MFSYGLCILFGFLIVVAFCALVARVMLRIIRVSGSSMAPTLNADDRVLVLCHWPTKWLGKGQIVIGDWNNFPCNSQERQPTLQTLVTIDNLDGLNGEGPTRSPSAETSSFETKLKFIKRLIGATSMIMLVSFTGALLAFSPLLAMLVVVAALPRLYKQLKIGHQRFGLTSRLSPDQRRVSYYDQILSGNQAAKEIRLFGLADYFLDAWRRTSKKIHLAQRTQELFELRWQLLLEFFSTLCSNVAFVVVLLQAFAGRSSLGDVMLYTSAVGSVQGALLSVTSAISSLNEQALFFTHYRKLMALPQVVLVVSQPRPVPMLASGIELRNVFFRYTEQHPWILQNLNLHIRSGTCVALVGLNGAGKTTLVKLLTRLYDPTEGEILWDGIDIRELDPQGLRHRIGAIFQDFMRYELSVRENVGLGDVAYIEDMERIRDATLKADVQALVESLPQGYQTILSRWLVEEGIGIDLSGGEWQKIAIARMFMRSADLLILDEPTAALDAQAEYNIYKRFAKLVAGNTSLLISHRFGTVRMADAIAVLKDGRIVEYGTHAELLAQRGTYAQLFTMQAERYSRTS